MPKPYQPKTGARCGCRPGVQRDNCPACEGTGWQIDFAAIRQQTADSAPVRCEPCLGMGYKGRYRKTAKGKVWKVETCRACGGTGAK